MTSVARRNSSGVVSVTPARRRLPSRCSPRRRSARSCLDLRRGVVDRVVVGDVERQDERLAAEPLDLRRAASSRSASRAIRPIRARCGRNAPRWRGRPPPSAGDRDHLHRRCSTPFAEALVWRRSTILSRGGTGGDPRRLRSPTCSVWRRFELPCEPSSGNGARRPGRGPDAAVVPAPAPRERLRERRRARDGRRARPRMHLAQSTVTELVNRVERAGLVQRTTLGDGRARRHIALTAEASGVLRPPSALWPKSARAARGDRAARLAPVDAPGDAAVGRPPGQSPLLAADERRHVGAAHGDLRPGDLDRTREHLTRRLPEA